MSTVERPPVVVVGVDGSDCSHEALRWAESYALATNASLRLVTAWHWPTSYGVTMYWDGFDPAEDARVVIEKAAAKLTLSSDRVETLVVPGAAGDVLVRHSSDADLLVVGSRGHGTVAGALLGSVSAHCAHHASCPVVIAR